MELVYPKDFSAEDKEQLGLIMAKAEVLFRKGTRNASPTDVKDVWLFEDLGCKWVEAIVLRFGLLYPVYAEIEKFIPSACEYVFEKLPDHPEPDWDDVPHFRRKKFMKKAEEFVRSSEPYLGLISNLPFGWRTSFIPIPEDPNDWVTKELRRAGVQRYQDKVQGKTGEKLTKKDIWTYCGYESSQDFNRWQRCDEKTSDQAKKAFLRFFRDEPHLKTLLLTILSISS